MTKHPAFNWLLGVTAMVASSSLLASSLNNDRTPIYVAAKVGIFQASFNSTYLDQADLIQQNIAQLFQQHGYTEGLAIGYSKVFYQQYLAGIELSGSYDSHAGNFQAGASTAAFSDNVRINNHFDLTFVPGLMLNDATAVYLKLGVSRASIQDTVYSPTGFTPTIARFTNNTNANGFVAGLGFERSIIKNVSVFVEGNYRDYGTATLASFQNFTASYSNSSHIYTYDASLGVAYHF
jgi:opacity protein-like surface antigen